MTSIELRCVSRTYRGVTALQDINLTIAAGEFFTLVGPSGAGKTTLLRLLAGLDQPSAGTVLFDDQDVTRVPAWQRDVGMVFQDYALYPHMTVGQNIGYPLRLRRVPLAEAAGRIQEVADALEIGHLLSRRPADISGGQRQRVAVARGLAHKPRLFLFDEPLSNLDGRMRLEARAFIRVLQRQLGITTLYVTHDQSEAMALSDRMAVLAEGRLRQVGTPQDVYRQPADAFVASFIGSPPMNLLQAEAVAGGVRIGGHLLATDASIPAGQLTLGLRPEALHWDPSGTVPATVLDSEDLGHEVLVTVDLGGQRAVLRSTPPAPPPGTVGAVAITLATACYYPA